jgi:hypothetical protein
VAELRGAGAHVVGLPAVREAGLGRTRLARLLHAELSAEAAAAA